MRFVKMNGLGNDYIFAEEKDWPGPEQEEIRRACDVHRGIGGDGLVLYTKEEIPSMRIFNRDGTEAQMCGNALRCLVRLLANDGEKIRIRTRSGLLWGVPHGEIVRIKVADNVSHATETVRLSLRGKTICGKKVNVGNPHFVVSEDYDDDLAREISENREIFPERTNVEFVRLEKDGVVVRVYERGCGETLACGTGAAAVTIALNKKRLRVALPGGELFCERVGNDVLQTGKVAYNFTGEYYV